MGTGTNQGIKAGQHTERERLNHEMPTMQRPNTQARTATLPMYLVLLQNRRINQTLDNLDNLWQTDNTR